MAPMPYRRGAAAAGTGLVEGHGGDHDQHTHAGRGVGLALPRPVSPGIFTVAARMTDRRGGGRGRGRDGAAAGRGGVRPGVLGFLWPQPGPKPELNQGPAHAPRHVGNKLLLETPAAAPAEMSGIQTTDPASQQLKSGGRPAARRGKRARRGRRPRRRRRPGPPSQHKCRLRRKNRCKIWPAATYERPNLPENVSVTSESYCDGIGRTYLPMEHDAIARLKKERDESRTLLAQANRHIPILAARPAPAPVAASNALEDEVGPDGKKIRPGINPATIVELLKCKYMLSTQRKKWQVPPRLAPLNVLGRYTQISSHLLHKTNKPGILSIDSSHSKDIIATGGMDTNAVVIDRPSGQVLCTLAGHSKKVFRQTVGQMYSSESRIFCRVCETRFSGALLQELDVTQESSISLEKGDLPPIRFLNGYELYDPAVVREEVENLKRAMKVEIAFSEHHSSLLEAKEDDTLRSILERVDSPFYSDSYYTCGRNLLDLDTTLSKSILLSGLKIVAHPRLRGGNGEGSSQGANGDEASSSSTLQKIPFKVYIQQQIAKKDWLEVVEVPETMYVFTDSNESFVVTLGRSGTKTLRLLVECLERKWRRKMTLNGKFTEDDIFYDSDYDLIEINCEETHINQDGFDADCTTLQLLIPNYFQFYHARRRVSLYPMFVQGLMVELDNAIAEKDYFASADKRSLLHNNAATMMFERRIQITTAVIRYWKAIQGQARNKKAFNEALTADASKIEHNMSWVSRILRTSKILYDRLIYHGMGHYKDTILSFWEYSRCLYEHGPTLNVTEKQCEAALYLLDRHMFHRMHKQILTEYVEVQPVAQIPRHIVATPQPVAQIPQQIVAAPVQPQVVYVTPRFMPSARAKAIVAAKAREAEAKARSEAAAKAREAAIQHEGPPHVVEWSRNKNAAAKDVSSTPVESRRLAFQDVPHIPVSNNSDVKRLFSKN